MSSSFETKFFGPPLTIDGKDGKATIRRACKYCGYLASEQNERRRNHLKAAETVCNQKFMEANRGMSFKDYVLATQPQSTIERIYPGHSREPAAVAGMLSPASATASAFGRTSTPLGFVPGDVGEDEVGGLEPVGFRGGGSATPLSPLGPPVPPFATSAPDLTAAPPAPFVHSTGMSGRPHGPGSSSGGTTPGSHGMYAHFRKLPTPEQRATFQQLLVSVMCACAYSANSLQHKQWFELIKFLWPGMETEIPSSNTIM
jgi:hypothetical protein